MRLSLFAVVTLCVSSLAARADTVYNYVGQDFAYVSGPYTTMDKVTGSFTVADPLAANYSGDVRPISFSFSDGVQTINNFNTKRQAFEITTDADGAFEAYTIVVGNPAGEPMMRLREWTYAGVGDFGGDFVISDGPDAAVNLPGAFTEEAALAPTTSVTPEPSSIALLGSGLLGVAGVVRKRCA